MTASTDALFVPDRTPYTPPTDFLLMGEGTAESLVWSIGPRVAWGEGERAAA